MIGGIQCYVVAEIMKGETQQRFRAFEINRWFAIQFLYGNNGAVTPVYCIAADVVAKSIRQKIAVVFVADDLFCMAVDIIYMLPRTQYQFIFSLRYQHEYFTFNGRDNVFVMFEIMRERLVNRKAFFIKYPYLVFRAAIKLVEDKAGYLVRPVAVRYFVKAGAVEPLQAVLACCPQHAIAIFCNTLYHPVGHSRHFLEVGMFERLQLGIHRSL